MTATCTATPAPVLTTGPTGDHGTAVRRFRLMACSLVLTALAFVQDPGRVVADTKLDLVLAPWSFLGRALHLWDPQGAFGQVQNQAYGYLFPMGPFFGIGHSAGLPAWVVQRLWWALLLVVAFTGLVSLARELGIGTDTSRLVAGFAYALSPRLLTTLGPISVEALPSTLAPWVLLALVVGSRRGSPVRAAALAALGVGLVGGVNAAATFAVLPLGVLWLVTRAPGRRRRTMLLWWPLLTLVATLWWLVPLLLLGAYSPPFLDFIETASVTTFPTTLFDAVRGTSDWVPYVDARWRAGNDLVTVPVLVLNGAVVMVLGLVGLARRDLPERRFLVLATLLGVALVDAGHLGPVQGWFAEPLHDLLDAALAPLRNVHKLDPVVRVPMVLGLAHLLAVAGTRTRELVAARGRREAVRWRRVPAGLLVLAIVAVAGAAGPALAGRLAAGGSFDDVPDYWRQTATWLGEHDDGTRALLLPGSSFGTYVWGDPVDEPLQGLATSPWAVRNAIPLAPPGNIRMLDAVEDRMVRGEGSAGLADYLRRAGVGWVVVRNDLVRSGDVADPVRVHQAVAETPGLRLVTTFGPVVGGPARLDDGTGDRVVVSQGWQDQRAAVEVYRVGGAETARVATGTTLVAGGPEDLLDLSDAGVLGSEPTQLAADVRDRMPGQRLVLTDGLRLRDRSFGRLHESASAVLTSTDEARAGVPATDYLDEGWSDWQTRARLLGARRLSASSSMSDADAFGAVRPDQAPYAAFDLDPRTEWVSGFGSGSAWLRLDLVAERSVDRVVVRAGRALGSGRQELRVRTATGVSDVVDVAAGERVLVPLPPGRTSWLRLEGASGVPGQRLAVAAVRVPGVRLARPLVLPRTPSAWGTPDVVAMSSTAGFRSACVRVDGDTRCAPGRGRLGEEARGLDRVVPMNESEVYEPRVWVRANAGRMTLERLQRGRLVRVEASSAAVAEPAGSALAAVDGNPATTWVADPADDAPALEVRWVRPTLVRSLQVRVDRDAAATPPTEATLVYPGGRQRVGLRDGRARVVPIRTGHLRIELTAHDVAHSLDFDGSGEELGIGVSELRLGGAGGLPSLVDAAVRSWGCGSGPDLLVGEQRVRTRVTASPRDLFARALVQAQPCDAPWVTLGTGENRVRLGAHGGFTGARVVLERPYAEAPSPGTSAPLTRESAVRAQVPLPPGAGGQLAVRENANPGWSGLLGGTSLTSARVDGWQQGWALPEPAAQSGDEVLTRFVPDAAYRVGLAAGAVLLALLALAVLLRRPRDPRGRAAEPAGEHPRLAASAPLAAATALPLVAGWWGALAATLVLGGAWVLSPGRRWSSWNGPALVRRWLPDASWWVGAPVVLAAVVYVVRPWGSPDGWAGDLGWPQLLVVASLAALAACLLPGQDQSRSRAAGSSTPR
jgi:arabinofuranan 3-O-arabinosyltransferase